MIRTATITKMIHKRSRSERCPAAKSFCAWRDFSASLARSSSLNWLTALSTLCKSRFADFNAFWPFSVERRFLTADSSACRTSAGRAASFFNSSSVTTCCFFCPRLCEGIPARQSSVEIARARERQVAKIRMHPPLSWLGYLQFTNYSATWQDTMRDFVKRQFKERVEGITSPARASRLRISSCRRLASRPAQCRRESVRRFCLCVIAHTHRNLRARKSHTRQRVCSHNNRASCHGPGYGRNGNSMAPDKGFF